MAIGCIQANGVTLGTDLRGAEAQGHLAFPWPRSDIEERAANYVCDLLCAFLRIAHAGGGSRPTLLLRGDAEAIGAFVVDAVAGCR